MNVRISILLSILLLFFVISVGSAAFCQENNLLEAKDLTRQIYELYQLGHYNQAVPLAEKALTLFETAVGPEHPFVSSALNNLANLHMALGNYTQAEPLLKRSLAIDEHFFGPDHEETASGLNNLATLYYYLGDYGKAEKHHRRAIKIRETVLGPDDPAVAISLNNLAAVYDAQGRYDEARTLYERSLDIREKVYGPDHPRVASALNNLAGLFEITGDYVQAELYYQRALGIEEKILGPNHPNVASTLNNLGLVYDAMGEYIRAEPLYRRSLFIKEQVLGPNHPEVAGTLNNLAEIHTALGEFPEAEPLYERALAIREETLGPDHPDTAQSLNNLALLYEARGDYARAEPLYQRALAAWENSLGSDHPDVASSLNNLAEFYQALGDAARARPLYDRALAIREKTFGPDHPDVAVSLNNLSGFYRRQKKLNQARSLSKRALAIWEKVLGPDHPHVAVSLNNLAELLYADGDYNQARPLYERALAIREKVFGSEHPDVANSLIGLAGLHYAAGELTQAEALYKKALAILTGVLGPDHPLVGRAKNNLAVIYAAAGDFEKAFALMTESQKIDKNLIDQVMGFTSENQKMSFLLTKKQELDAYLSLAVQYLKQDPLVRRQAFDVWLRRKGVILEAQRRFQEALFYSNDPQVRQTFQELARVRALLSRLTFTGPGRGGPEIYREKMEQLKKQKQALEATLSRLSQAYAVNLEMKRANATDLARSLPSGSVLLDFARIDVFNFGPHNPAMKWKPARYLAYILQAGANGETGLVDLGEAEIIDQKITAFKQAVNDLSDVTGKNAREASRELYRLVFAPLEAAIGPAREIYISPDGNLNLIPFEILLSPRDRYLIDDFTFNYLTSGREVLSFDRVREGNEKALLMGNPDFDLTRGQRESVLRNMGLQEERPQVRSGRATDMPQFSFTELPGTEKEILSIKAILGPDAAECYLGAEAIEDVIRQKKSPRLIHLATHGFFLSDVDLTALSDWRTSNSGLGFVSDGEQRKIFGNENPLLRSGLALAGANSALRTDTSDRSDGLLTAEKVLGLRLRETELVVLSACETGLGEVKSGEGVYGLRRAFTQAGAESLVMSLWSVPDLETQELMVRFYRNLVSGKMNRAQALRQAALKEKDLVNTRYGHTNPLFWGAFIFMGKP